MKVKRWGFLPVRRYPLYYYCMWLPMAREGLGYVISVFASRGAVPYSGPLHVWPGDITRQLDWIRPGSAMNGEEEICIGYGLGELCSWTGLGEAACSSRRAIALALGG